MNRIVAVLLNRLMIWVIGADLWERAQTWVALYENRELPPAEKRGCILVMLETELWRERRTLTTSILNLVIEAAVQYVRRNR